MFSDIHIISVPSRIGGVIVSVIVGYRSSGSSQRLSWVTDPVGQVKDCRGLQIQWVKSEIVVGYRSSGSSQRLSWVTDPVGHIGGVIVSVFVCGRSWVTDPVGQASSVVDRGL